MQLTKADLAAIKQELARRKLIKFIEYTKPDYQTGWFHREVCRQLENFYELVRQKKSPRLMLYAPPRHGKTEIVSRRFPAWVFGKNPNLEMITCSYASDLANRINRDVQRIIDDESYRYIFPETTLAGKRAKPTDKGNFSRKSDLFEIVGHRGSFRSAGVGGGITGTGADILVIDDPCKDAKEANSPTVQQSVYEWWQTTASTRISPGGGAILMMTRWNQNDLAGRILQDDPESWKVVKYPAVAMEDEAYRKEGEALHPDRFDEARLAQIEKTVGSYAWAALFQQSPVPKGGGLIKAEKFEIGTPPVNIKRIVRYWDKGGTESGGARTAGVKMGVDDQGRYWVLDVRKDQLSALRREQMIKQTAELDGPRVKIYTEQEPGSGGKESAEATIRNLAGYRAYAERVTGDKVTRAEPFAAQVEAGNVFLAKAEWNKDFIDECQPFPFGKFKDQVDAAAGAFNKLSGVKQLDYSKLLKK